MVFFPQKPIKGAFQKVFFNHLLENCPSKNCCYQLFVRGTKQKHLYKYYLNPKLLQQKATLHGKVFDYVRHNLVQHHNTRLIFPEPSSLLYQHVVTQLSKKYGPWGIFEAIFLCGWPSRRSPFNRLSEYGVGKHTWERQAHRPVR